MVEELLVEKESLAACCHKLYLRGLVSGCGGNVSLRVEDRVLMTPSGYALDEVRATDIVEVGLDGGVLKGDKKPTSEIMLHLNLYNMRADIKAIVHTHSPAATSFAYLGRPVVPVNPESSMCLSKLPLVPYYPYGTLELADATASCMGTASACLLEKHGVVACGMTLREAFHVAEIVEETAMMNIYVMQIKMFERTGGECI